jgi:hypothetical protein
MYNLVWVSVTAQNFCKSKSQLKYDYGSKTIYHAFACSGSGQTDSVITNCSDKWLNFLSGIKCHFETMNFDGMIMLSCSVIEKVLSAQKE